MEVSNYRAPTQISSGWHTFRWPVESQARVTAEETQSIVSCEWFVKNINPFTTPSKHGQKCLGKPSSHLWSPWEVRGNQVESFQPGPSVCRKDRSSARQGSRQHSATLGEVSALMSYQSVRKGGGKWIRTTNRVFPAHQAEGCPSEIVSLETQKVVLLS